MITLEQILLLESRVRKAVERIETLNRENSSLRDNLAANERRIGELEVLISTFKEDQGRIEQGILSALEQLDQLEDEVDQGAEGMAAESSSSSDEHVNAEEQDSTQADSSEPDAAAESSPSESPEDGAMGEEPRDEHHDAARDSELDIF